MDNLVLHYYYFSNSRPCHCTNMAITNIPFIIMFLSWWKSWLTPSWSWSSWHKVVTPHCVSVPVCVPVPRTACHTVARLQSSWWRCACPDWNSNESLQASPRASVSPEASDWVSPRGKKGSKEGLYHHEMTVTMARKLLRNFIFWFFKVCAPAPVLAHPHRAHHTKPVHGK